MHLLKLLPNIEGINIRVLHYLAVESECGTKPDGTVYQNTIEDFEFLNMAYEQACYFSLVPYCLFSNFNVVTHIKLSCQQKNHLFKLMFDNLCKDYSHSAAAANVDVHVEIWLEDSFSGSLILPVAKRYNVNFVVTLQPMFVGTLFQFLRRVAVIDKPVRVLYLCDFDYHNRFEETYDRVEMLLKKYQVKKDVKLHYLMLKECQCEYLNLPVMPNSSRVELSAMEVRYPGAISRVLQEYLRRYIDSNCICETIDQTRQKFAQILPEVIKMIDAF